MASRGTSWSCSVRTGGMASFELTMAPSIVYIQKSLLGISDHAICHEVTQAGKLLCFKKSFVFLILHVSL